MDKETKWGLFIGDKAIKEYPRTEEGYKEALKDLNFVFSQIGVPYELKKF